MYRLWFRLVEVLRLVAGSAIMLALVLALLLFKLGRLLPGLADSEIATLYASRSASAILSNPLYAPYKAITYLVQKLNLVNFTTLRLGSVIFGLLAAVLFYYIVKNWHNKHIARLSTLLFISSSWFLHSSRLASPLVSHFLILGLIACAVWLTNTKKTHWALLVSGAGVIASLYIPGFIWLWLALAFWRRQAVVAFLKQTTKVIKAEVGIIFLVSFVPLILAFIRDPGLVLNWLGLPEILPTPLGYLRNVLEVPLNLFIRGPSNPSTWLMGVPVLDIFSIGMFVLGIYNYYLYRQLDRSKLLLGSLVIGLLLAGFDSEIAVTLLLGPIYIVVAAGLTYLLTEWYSVFPRNPFARAVGVSLLTAAVAVSCLYHIRHYFIAWPNTPATKQEFANQSLRH